MTERANFPTDLYMLEGLIRQLGSRHELRLMDHDDDISASITDAVAVVVLTHVSYRTGRMLDMAHCTQLAHQAYAPSNACLACSAIMSSSSQRISSALMPVSKSLQYPQKPACLTNSLCRTPVH